MSQANQRCMMTETMWSVHSHCKQCQGVQFTPESMEQFSIMRAMWLSSRLKEHRRRRLQPTTKVPSSVQTITVYQQIVVSVLDGSAKSGDRGKQGSRLFSSYIQWWLCCNTRLVCHMSAAWVQIRIKSRGTGLMPKRLRAGWGSWEESNEPPLHQVGANSNYWMRWLSQCKSLNPVTIRIRGSSRNTVLTKKWDVWQTLIIQTFFITNNVRSLISVFKKMSTTLLPKK